ncbi:MAG TPA: hypothetical protein VME69_04665 [Methylocella sp.]|nr:hypothetical protein [Methylocella sp.]
MSYLAPPPMPAAVIVTKDVGGYVTDYHKQTDYYRSTQREVRLHECRSACTLALSLPNVCVYKGSILKFHLAYDPRNHQPNEGVSRWMFASYPAAVQARLGTLTRDYKVLRGSELIALGIRDCDAPKPVEPKPANPQTLMASAAPPLAGPTNSAPPVLASLMGKVLSVFGSGDAAGAGPTATASAQTHSAPASSGRLLAGEIPLPPQRPADFSQTAANLAEDRNAEATTAPNPTSSESAGATDLSPSSAEVPLPPSAGLRKVALPRLITGAQPILAPNFSAYADLGL